MIEIPDTDNLDELREFKRDLHRALYAVTERIQELENKPPDLGIHVSDGLGVKMEQR